MDLQMPVMDGIEATKTIRSIDEYVDLPIIAMTASAYNEDKEKCISSGMNDHLAKPINPELLYSTIKQWLPDHSISIDNEINPLSGYESEGIYALNKIKGLNANQGLIYIGNEYSKYITQLENFIYRYGDYSKHLKQNYDDFNFKEILRLSHSLKGVASSLGMDILTNITDEIEKKLSNKNNSIENHIDELSDEISELLNSLKEVLSHISKPKSLQQRFESYEVKQILFDINEHLSNHNPKAKDLLLQILPQLVSEFGKDARQLELNILSYEYDKSLDIVQRFIDSYTGEIQDAE